MENILMWIKKHWVRAAIIILGLVITTWAVGRACRVEDKYSRLVGVYQAYRAINSAATKQLKVNIAAKEERIVQLDGQVAALNHNVERLRLNLGIKDRAIVELEASFITTADMGAKLFNMTQQRDLWREKFTLAEAVIADREQQITLLNLKVDELWGISESYKKMHESELTLRLAAENAFRACGGKLRAAKFWGGAKNVAVGVLAGYVVYQAVKK